MIKNLIFDLGGVLYLQKPYHGEKLIAKTFSIPIGQAKEINDYYEPKLMKGEITSIEFLKKIKISLKDSQLFSSIFKKWNDLFIKNYLGLNEALISLINKLKSQYKIFIFTNTIDTHDDYIKTLGLYEHFDYIYKSYLEHIFKPERNSYLYVVNKIKAKPEECVFVDNLEENVKAAERIGLKGIVYKNMDQLKRDFERLGVKI